MAEEFIFILISILQLFRVSKSSIFTSPAFRTPRTFLRIYMPLEILLINWNQITRPYLLMFINSLMTILSVSGQIALIQFHDRLEPENMAYAFSLSLAATAYLILTYFKLGDLNKQSKKAVAVWKRKARINDSLLHSKQNQLILRHMQSLGLLQIQLGDFGHYKREYSLRIIGKLIFYTSKGIMVLKKFI